MSWELRHEGVEGRSTYDFDLTTQDPQRFTSYTPKDERGNTPDFDKQRVRYLGLQKWWEQTWERAREVKIHEVAFTPTGCQKLVPMGPESFVAQSAQSSQQWNLARVPPTTHATP